MRLFGRSQFGGGLTDKARPSGFGAWVVWVFVLALMFGMSPAGAQSLDLSQDQKQKLKTLASDTRDRIEAQRQALRRARADLRGVYQEYKMDDHKARVAMGQLSDAQKRLLDVQLDNQAKLRQILNAAQFAKFQELMSQRMRGFGFAIALPMEEELLDMGLGPDVCDKLGLSASQEKRLEQVKRLGGKKPEVIGRLRKSAEQLADVYSKYDMDAKAARRLTDSIHRDQVVLTTIAYKSQQTMRWWLNSDQFGQLQQLIAKRVKEHGQMRRHHMEKDE